MHLVHAHYQRGLRSFPATLQALAEVKARIREVWQWYFRRELLAVAKEICAPGSGECPSQDISVI